MTDLSAPADRQRWLASGGSVLALHALAVAGVVMAGMGTIAPPPPEPVVIVELPPLAAAAQPQQVSEAQVQPVEPDQPIVERQITPVEAPPVAAPLPREVVAAAPPQPPQPAQPLRQPQRPPVAAASPAPQPAPSAAAAPSNTAGNDPRARQQEADYFSLVNAHLARNKRYPREARQARQQGVVTVRFTVSRDGTVSNASIRNSSGHELLDQATLDLLRRVSPLPRFPRSMTRDSVTLTLPIEYSLRTD